MPATKTSSRKQYWSRKNAGLCIYCGKEPQHNGTVYCRLCSRRKAKDTRERNRWLKMKVFEAYGGARCTCCGETVFEMLTIDHVNNDGAQHRKEKRMTGAHLCRWLYHQGFPTGYQVLCMNCNLARHLNGGTCPHETRTI